MATREERIEQLKAQRDKVLEDYKAKIAAKKAEYDRRIKATAKGGGSERKRQAHLKIVLAGVIMRESKADESGKIAKLVHTMLSKLAGDLSTPERLRKDYQELAKLFEPK